MRLTRVSQASDINVLGINSWDLFIVASSFESRAVKLACMLTAKDWLNGSERLYLKFNEQADNAIRRKNDELLETLGFVPLLSSSSDNSILVMKLHLFLTSMSWKESVNVLIDYTCMTKVMYGGIIKLLSLEEFSNIKINVTLSYSHGEYLAPPIQTRNMFVGPISGYSYMTPVVKPTALIIGLGNEVNRAFGLQEYFDSTPFYFVGNSDSNEQYGLDAALINEKLLNSVHESHVFHYSVNNFVSLQSDLISLCKDLNERYRVIIAPCGPKPFTLAALLVAVQLKSVEVWRVSAAEDIRPFDKEASNKYLFVQLEYSGFD